MEFFPNGVTSYLVGGLLIGAGVSAIHLTTGLVAGASSVFTTTWSWLSRRREFQRPEQRASRGWRLTFALALVLGAALFTFALGDGRAFHTEVSPWRLLVGGFLAGLGTRLSRGCTSGHGICGLSAGSLPSLLATGTFLVVAIATALALRAAGVTP